MNSHEVRREWADRSGEYSPDYYAYYGPNETSERLREILDATVGPTAAVLEVGCSSGRHLSHLHDHGYRDLHGIDLNAEAFEVMAESYPALAADGTFHVDAVEDVVTEFADDRFDAVFSVETLQHLHPDDDRVFAELARITGEVLVTAEIEGGQPGAADGGVNYVGGEFPLYYRDWHRVFTDLGFEEIDSQSVGTETLRAFRPTGN